MIDQLLAMSKKDIDRHDVLKRLVRKEIKRKHAATLLKLTVRHVTRLKQAVIAHGPSALIHKQRGRPSHNRLPEQERQRIACLLKEKYADFGPAFAAEKLSELHKIHHDPKTIRAIQVQEGLWNPRRPKTRDEHRSWRQRRSAFGEMEQFDGSYHDWFEGRGGIDEACLLAAIDDATGKLTKLEFAPHEGVFPVFAFWKQYIENNGKPRQIYMDKFSTYKMNSAAAKDNPDLKTQFQRAMIALHIEPIFAQSPQAKGRVERLFDTIQDRLVKELRLANIMTVEEASRFLKETFIPMFNEKFAVEPVSSSNMHQTLTEKEKKLLPSIFSRQEKRTVQNDFTFSFQNQWYQLTEQQPVTICKKDEVTIEEHLDHSIHVRLRGKELGYVLLPERPKKALAPFVIAKSAPRITKPRADHPWRQRFHADALKATS
jgi:transposase-like protein